MVNHGTHFADIGTKPLACYGLAHWLKKIHLRLKHQLQKQFIPCYGLN